jgi:hypothetical protein
MVVRTLNSGRAVTGLYVGPRNVRRYFPKNAKSVELQMGHLRIHCELQPDFWQGRPEICDARLSGWLESRIFHHRLGRAPAPIAMIPVGKNAFRLHPFPLPSAAGNGLVRMGPLPAPLHPYEGKGKAGAAPGRPRRFIDSSGHSSR